MSELTDATSPASATPPPPWWEYYTPRQVALATLVIGLVVVGFGLLIELRSVLLVCFVAIVISTAVQPAAERLQRLRVPRTLALLLVYALLLTALAALIFLLVPPLVVQLSELFSQLPATYATVIDQLRGSRLELLRRVGYSLPTAPLPTQGPPEAGAGVAATLVSAIPTVAAQLFTFTITLLLSYYWVLYRSRAVQVVMLTLPGERRERANALWAAVEGKVGAFVRGQFILCVAILLLSLLGYSLIGLPYAVVIAVLAGVLEAVPYIGPLITGVLAVGIGLSVSPQLALLALVVSLVVQQLESTLLVPRVMDKAVGVSPVVTLLALTAFSLLFGLLGALLAIPLAAILQIALDRWLLNPPAETTIQGRDRLAVLQYEVQQLIQDVRSQVRVKADAADERADDAEEELESILASLDDLLRSESPQQAPVYAE